MMALFSYRKLSNEKSKNPAGGDGTATNYKKDFFKSFYLFIFIFFYIF